MKNRSYVKVEFGADIPWGVTLGEKNLNNNNNFSENTKFGDFTNFYLKINLFSWQ